MLFLAVTGCGLYWLSHMPESTTADLLAAINRFTDPPGRQAAFDDPRTVVRLDSDDSYDLTLAQAIDQRLLDLSFQGVDLLQVVADVRRLPDRPLRLALMPGTLLTPANADSRYQAVIVREKRVLQIPAKGLAVRFRIPVLALSMSRDIPTGIALRPSNATADKAILALLAKPSFPQLRPAMQQYAVWTLTDNPAFDEFVGIYSGNGRVEPNRQDVAALAQVFRDAGLDTTKYRVFEPAASARLASSQGMGASPMRPAGVSPTAACSPTSRPVVRDGGSFVCTDGGPPSASKEQDEGQEDPATDEATGEDSPAAPPVAADGDPPPPSADGPAIILIRNGKTTVVPRM